MTLWFLLLFLASTKSSQQWTVNISDSSSNEFYYYWAKAVGSGHAALLLRQDWRAWMKNGHDKINFSMVRCHGILDDDVGSVNGINDYSFVNVDKIYSYLLSINMKPYVELSYMPCDYFATNPTETRNHYQWCGSPPKSYDTFYSYIQQFTQHLVDFFGLNEVQQWHFEVWNEPDGTYPSYSEYLKLYNATARAIKSVDKSLMVGGPTTTNFNWLNKFLEDIISKGIPIDFVATHSYPNQLKIENINSWLNEIQTKGINVVDEINAKYNLSLPLIISEYNSGCCMTPFDSGKFMNDDNYYAAAFLIFWAKHLQSVFDKGAESTLQLLSYWAISDVFDESDFNSNEFNNLYGLQTIRGIPKPAFRAFELLHKYGSDIEYQSILVEDDNGFPVAIANSSLQVYCLKNVNSNDNSRYSVFVSNWNNYGFPIVEQNVIVNIANNIENKNILQSVTMYRIDANNTAPLSSWIAMGSPKYPTTLQIENLNASSQVNKMQINHTIVDQNTIQFDFNVPIYGVIVLDLQY